MAIVLRRNAGMLVLGIWLVLHGLAALIPLGFAAPLMPLLALIAGVLILAGR